MNAGIEGSSSPAASAAAQLDGFHPALLVAVAVAAAGLLVSLTGLGGDARTALAGLRRAGVAVGVRR